MIDKKEFLLHSIIRAYIQSSEPIGSSQLKSMYDIAYSPATIRGYFKKLGDEGYLAQEHVSSGRTPTVEALKQYWISKLNFELPSIDYERLNILAKNMNMCVFILQIQENKLQRVINIEDSYMILEFDTFYVTVEYSSPLFRFINDMVGMSADDMLNVTKQVGAKQLYDELKRFIQKNEFGIINLKSFMQFAVHYDMDENLINKFMNGSIMYGLKEDMYFENLLPSGFMGVCHETKIGEDRVKMLVLGELNKDFEYFYKGII
jgi:heat-inducible transcriptional repressor